jgi:ribonuclease E
MARTHSSIATDSEEALRDIVGPDATAGFEDDPKFIDADPTSTASSDNVAVQRDTDDLEDSEEEELESEEDEDDVDDEDEEDEEVDDEAEAALQTKTFDDLGEEDDDAGDVEAGLDEDTLDEDDLDTDRVTDAALSLDPVLRMAAAMRMAPSTSARSASHR